MPVVKKTVRASRSRFDTKALLMEAGLRLFAERPVDAVPIDDIVAEAGVAKGSFFNHFENKRHFFEVIATEIREDLESLVTIANADVKDPLERLMGGMVVTVHFALSQPNRTAVLLGGKLFPTHPDHPLNTGLKVDIEAVLKTGKLRQEAVGSGLLFWLGACNMLMNNLTERRLTIETAATRMKEVMIMALIGLGLPTELAESLAAKAATRLAEIGGRNAEHD